MAKVKNVTHTSTSEEIIIDANQEHTVFDARGRSFVIKRPSYLKELQYEEAMGEESGKITNYRVNAFFLSHIYKIDGIPVPKVNTKGALEALMERVGREGIHAVMKGVQEHFFPETAKTEEEEKTYVKK